MQDSDVEMTDVLKIEGNVEEVGSPVEKTVSVESINL